MSLDGARMGGKGRGEGDPSNPFKHSAIIRKDADNARER
jgi:hypothetical protein